MRLGSAVIPSSGSQVPLGPGCSVWLYRPRTVTTPLPAVLWIHGGGLLFGTARQDERFCQHLVDSLGVVVAAVEYRLPPQHPFPAPLDDCQAALQWLMQQEYVDAQRVAVAGASAGGGLAAALAQRCASRTAPPRPVFQLLVYPMLDDRTRATPHGQERMWDGPSNRLGWTAYLGPLGGRTPPEFAVPARQPDLRGLPPAWIGVGTLDLFFAEDCAYAQRLQQAGVPCTLEVVPGAYHAFELIQAGAPVSQAFAATQVAALAQGLGL